MSKIFKKIAQGDFNFNTQTNSAQQPLVSESNKDNEAQILFDKLTALSSKLEKQNAQASTLKSNYELFKTSTPFDDSEVPSAISPCSSIIKFNKFISSDDYIQKNTEYISGLQELLNILKVILTEASTLKTSYDSAISAAGIKTSEFEKANPETLIQSIKNEETKTQTEVIIANKTLKMFKITLPFKQRYVKVLARLCRAQNIKKKHDALNLKYVSDLRNLKLGYDDAIKIIKQWQAAFLSQVPKQKITSKEQAELMSESFVQAILEIETEKRKLVFERFKSTFGRERK